MNFSFFGYDLTLSELIASCCSLFLVCFYAVKTHGLKNIIKEVLSMMYKFKTNQSVEQSTGQDFPVEKDVYRLNKATNELEKTGEKVNLQEIINSCIETALDRALDRLMPKVEQEKDIVDLELMREDLDVAMEVSNRAEEYRSKFNLPDNYSINDIFNHVSLEAEKLDTKLKTVQEMKKTEVIKNEEKEIIEESK